MRKPHPHDPPHPGPQKLPRAACKCPYTGHTEVPAVPIQAHPIKPVQEPPALPRKMRLLPLIGATYFMVAGGPYGLEDIIGKAGYGRALLLLLLVPIFWSLPTSLMVGELASALPEEGGFYTWVRRALGDFWGFQEAWLSLSASVFDMAIYPVTFVLYLNRIAPSWTGGHRGTLWALAVVLGCALWNLRGAKAVGSGSLLLFVAMLSPFAVLILLGLRKGLELHAGLAAFTQPVDSPDLAGAISVCLWNYMGWDNASTVAQEVDDPQHTYPRAMLSSAALVAATYILPLAAVAFAGIPASQFSTGAWADAAQTLGWPHPRSRRRRRRHHQRHRHVQRAHDELHTTSLRARRRTSPSRRLHSQNQRRRPLAFGPALLARLGARPPTLLRTPHLHRPRPLRLQSPA